MLVLLASSTFTHAQLRASGGRVLCRAEQVLMSAWEYDWSVPPSKCCKKRLPHA